MSCKFQYLFIDWLAFAMQDLIDTAPHSFANLRKASSQYSASNSIPLATRPLAIASTIVVGPDKGVENRVADEGKELYATFPVIPRERGLVPDTLAALTVEVPNARSLNAEISDRPCCRDFHSPLYSTTITSTGAIASRSDIQLPQGAPRNGIPHSTI